MKNMARLVCLLVTVVMLFGLAACGEKAPSDPNHIVIDQHELQYKGACIMTDDEGKDAIVLTLDYTNNSKEDAAFWLAVFEKAMQDGIQLDTTLVYPDPNSYVSVTDDKFTDVAPGKTFEVRTAFALRDGVNPVEVRFSDLFDKKGGTITIDPTTLPREDPKPESAAAETAEAGADVLTGDALLDWWNGDWYGWWTVTGGDGAYASWSNQWWDCCANISIGADYTGHVILWDEDLPQDNAISEAGVTLNSAGTGEHGTLFSEDGYFLDGELAHADWIVDPGLADYDNLISIDGWYEDADGGFHYAMYLRPWGTSWDDIAADSPDSLPYYYESWYLPLVEAGKSMPDTLGGEAQDAGNEDAAAPQGGTEPNQTGTADGDYGKSNPNATGIAELGAMQELYKMCFENRTSAERLFNYEYARETLGCDGAVWKKSSTSWDENKHTYRWETADGKDYFNISFYLEDGQEWYFSCNMSENVINGLW